MSEYALNIDGDTYHPIPETWLTASAAYDPDAPGDAVRLYATSAAVVTDGRALRVRYVHPRENGVLTTYLPAACGDDGLVPAALADATGWPRSWTPGPDQEPHGIVRQPERDHFLDLWRDRLADLEADARVAIADGGVVQGGSPVVKTSPATPPRCRLSCPDGQSSLHPPRRQTRRPHQQASVFECRDGRTKNPRHGSSPGGESA
jgi:hypothetical protein